MVRVRSLSIFFCPRDAVFFFDFLPLWDVVWVLLFFAVVVGVFADWAVANAHTNTQAHPTLIHCPQCGLAILKTVPRFVTRIKTPLPFPCKK